jgi:hypothetical protein
LAGNGDVLGSTAAATTTCNKHRHIARSDDKTPSTTTTATTIVAASAAYSDLQDLAGSQAEIATDLGTATAGTDMAGKTAASALRTKGEDLITVGGRHCEVDEAPGKSEVEGNGASA